MTISRTTCLLSLSFSIRLLSRDEKCIFGLSKSSCSMIVTILIEASEILKLMSVMNC